MLGMTAHHTRKIDEVLRREGVTVETPIYKTACVHLHISWVSRNFPSVKLVIFLKPQS